LDSSHFRKGIQVSPDWVVSDPLKLRFSLMWLWGVISCHCSYCMTYCTTLEDGGNALLRNIVRLPQYYSA
jgi:hypothetical protein